MSEPMKPPSILMLLGKKKPYKEPEEDDDDSDSSSDDGGDLKVHIAKAILSAVHDNDPEELAQCLHDLIDLCQDGEDSDDE